MPYSKQLTSISAEPAWWILVLALFMIPFSMAACSILFTLLLAILLISVLKGEKLEPFPPYILWLAAFASLTLISTAFSRNPGESLVDNRELLLFLLIPIFQIVINSSRRLRISLAAVLLSGAVSASTGIITTIRRGGVSLDHRLHGFTSHWMTWSGLLMMVFVFFVVWLTQRHDPPFPHRGFAAIGLILILTAIPLSLTRSMWVGVAVSLGFYIILRRPKILFVLIPLMATAWFLLPQSVSRRVTSIVDPADPTNRDRIHMVYTGWRIFKDHPITGSGPNTIGELYPHYRHPDAIQNNPHLHNNFLQILAERGLPAALALLGFFVSLLISLFQRWRHDTGPGRRAAAASLFVAVAVLFSGMFEYNWGDEEIQFLFLFFIALPFAAVMNPANTREAA